MLMQSGRIYGAMSIRATQKLLSSSIPSNCCASERSSERTNRHEWVKHARMCWEMKSLWIIDNFSTWMVIISIAMVFSLSPHLPNGKSENFSPIFIHIHFRSNLWYYFYWFYSVCSVYFSLSLPTMSMIVSGCWMRQTRCRQTYNIYRWHRLLQHSIHFRTLQCCDGTTISHKITCCSLFIFSTISFAVATSNFNAFTLCVCHWTFGFFKVKLKVQNISSENRFAGSCSLTSIRWCNRIFCAVHFPIQHRWRNFLFSWWFSSFQLYA